MTPTTSTTQNIVPLFGSDTTPETQTESFRNQDKGWPARFIRRGEKPRPLPSHGVTLANLTYEFGGVRFGVDDFMTRRRTAGLLVLKHGEVALERYGLGNGPHSLWAGFSTTKSMISTLAGSALHEGAIGGLDDPCDAYVSRLRESAFEGVTIRNLLRMASGVAWREEDDAGGRSDIDRLAEALASRRPGSVLALARELPRVHPQGEIFNYSTIESSVLAEVIAAAVGRPLADYMSERVWGPAGMEADARWRSESDGGVELGGFGLSAVLRDMGRFGLLMLEDGEAFNGRRVWPSGWRDLAGRPDCVATAFGRLAPDDPSGYGYHWWSTPPVPGVHDGIISANGAYGQVVYINPAERVVAAIQSASGEARDREGGRETVALLRAGVQRLRS